MKKPFSSTKKAIINYLEQNPDTPVKELLREFAISKQAMQKHLAELVESGVASKKGSVPRVYYSAINPRSLEQNQTEQSQIQLDQNVQDQLQDFVTVSPSGVIITGQAAFLHWSKQRNFDPKKYAELYAATRHKYGSYIKDGLIDATNKMKKTFGKEAYLDKLYYSEFSAYEIFGKTSLYAYLLYGKQSEDRVLIDRLVQNIKDSVLKLIISQQIQAVGFVPPTVPRKLQFMRVLQESLAIVLPIIPIVKIKTPTIVPQKTLKRPEERAENAQVTFVVESSADYERVLLIDDFVGSGSTLNFIAGKYRRRHRGDENIIGYAICGTPNGIVNDSQKFEVVTEV